MTHRILRLITWLPNGGIERKIAAVLPRLDRQLFEPHVCCIRERGPLADQIEAAGIPVHVIPFRSRLDPLAIWSLHKLAKQIGANLVHSHMYRANVPGTILKMLNPDLVSVGHYHNVDTWESRRQLYVDRYLARRRDMNVAVSEAVRRNVVETLGISDYLTRTLYNCIDTGEFHPVAAAERHAIREGIGVHAADKLVLMLARLVPQKNQQLVLRAAPEILQEVPRVRFVFAGGGSDESELLRLAQELNLGDRVIFLGNRMDAPQLLAASDVAVLPSLKEGFSNAVLEAMACGLPVIASDVGGNREVIDHGTNGYILDVATLPDGHDSRSPVQVNASQFIRYVKRVLTDDGLHSRLSAAALETAQQFNLDCMVQDIEDLYLELLET